MCTRVHMCLDLSFLTVCMYEVGSVHLRVQATEPSDMDAFQEYCEEPQSHPSNLVNKDSEVMEVMKLIIKKQFLKALWPSKMAQ